MHRFGKGFTLQVKIGSPEDFIGAVSEPIQLRRQGSGGGSFLGSRRLGSRLGSLSNDPPSSPRSVRSPTPIHGDADNDDNTQSPAVMNFHNFIKETFENSTLIEEHQVNMIV